jgi:hypothetical protein
MVEQAGENRPHKFPDMHRDGCSSGNLFFLLLIGQRPEVHSHSPVLERRLALGFIQ